MPIIQILPDAIDTLKTNLICEVGDNGLSYYFQDNENKRIQGLSVYQLVDQLASNINNKTSIELKGLFDSQPILSKPFHKTVICYSFPESVLLPESLYEASTVEDVINLVHGDLHKGKVLIDRLPNKKLYNVYNIPQGLHEVVANQFPTATYIHQHTVLLRDELVDGDIMIVLFYQNKIVIQLVKSGNLQIIQSFSYNSTVGAVYQLLNVCHLYNMMDVRLRIGGMIEKSAALLDEISKYFSTIDFTVIQDVDMPEGLKELPPHYFSHLFSISRCV